MALVSTARYVDRSDHSGKGNQGQQPCKQSGNHRTRKSRIEGTPGLAGVNVFASLRGAKATKQSMFAPWPQSWIASLALAMTGLAAGRYSRIRVRVKRAIRNTSRRYCEEQRALSLL